MWCTSFEKSLIFFCQESQSENVNIWARGCHMPAMTNSALFIIDYHSQCSCFILCSGHSGSRITCGRVIISYSSPNILFQSSRSGGKEHILTADNHRTMMQWLQTLQVRPSCQSFFAIFLPFLEVKMILSHTSLITNYDLRWSVQ